MVNSLNPLKALASCVKEFYWGAWYGFVSRSDKENELTFMNYGYDNGRRISLKQEDEKNRYQIQLYDKIAKAIPGDLEDLNILEVGCGRGGGANYIAEYLQPKSLSGIDLCEPAIAFCKKQNTRGVSFMPGDAMQIPAPEESFDAVINVESSHRYPDMPKFLREVHRVLKSGGYFSFVDFRATGLLFTLDAQMKDSQMHVVEREVVTPGVLRAMKLDNSRKLDLIKRLVPRVLHKPAREFASIIGSASYESLKNHEREYVRYLLRK
jgi:ubiquinone/menaquinone biosynthesis C-methylase UbiE